MVTLSKTSDFVFRSLATGILTDSAWQPITDNLGTGRTDALNVPLVQGLRFRRVYLGVLITGTPTTVGWRLKAVFGHQGRTVIEWPFAMLNGVSGQPGMIPPFSVQEMALGGLSANQPALAAGDVPGSIVVPDYNLADGFMRYVRMTPLDTYQECDELRVSGDVYVTGATSVCKLFCAVHSSIVKA